MIRHTLPPDHNHTTKRFPRTTFEAFPEHPHAWFDKTDTLVVSVCVVALIVLVTLMSAGY